MVEKILRAAERPAVAFTGDRVCSIARARIQPSSMANAAPEPNAPTSLVSIFTFRMTGVQYQKVDDWHHQLEQSFPSQ